jgi:hypothetical protein
LAQTASDNNIKAQVANAEWRRLSQNEVNCVDQSLRAERSNLWLLIQQGIKPSDSRVAGIRAACRTQGKTVTGSGSAAHRGSQALAASVESAIDTAADNDAGDKANGALLDEAAVEKTEASRKAAVAAAKKSSAKASVDKIEAERNAAITSGIKAAAKITADLAETERYRAKAAADEAAAKKLAEKIAADEAESARYSMKAAMAKAATDKAEAERKAAKAAADEAAAARYAARAAATRAAIEKLASENAEAANAAAKAAADKIEAERNAAKSLADRVEAERNATIAAAKKAAAKIAADKAESERYRAKAATDEASIDEVAEATVIGWNQKDTPSKATDEAVADRPVASQKPKYKNLKAAGEDSARVFGRTGRP